MRQVIFFIFTVCLNVIHTQIVFANLADAASDVQQIVAHRGASSDRPECTLSALRRAIEVKVTTVEIDVRTSKDGILFLMHDAKVDRTTNGTGLASQMTMAELKQLDAGSRFNKKYQGESIPTLREALKLCRGKIDVLLDLKEQGVAYSKAVSKEVQEFGDPQRTIIGVRSVEQSQQFRKLLPKTKQMGFIPSPQQIDAFAKAGVETIRLWPKWLTDESHVTKIRHLGLKLPLNGSTGKPQEIIPLLKLKPDSLLVDDPAMLIATLNDLKKSRKSISIINDLVTSAEGTTLVPSTSHPESATFLNRKYKMLTLPKELGGQPRYYFDGGSGHRAVIKFKKSAVVFAVFNYNSSGTWSFPKGRTPQDNGWRLFRKNAYRGTSNGLLKEKPHFASIYYCEFTKGQKLSGLPPWWICLAIMNPDSAKQISDFKAGTSGPVKVTPSFSYAEWATQNRPLVVPQFKNTKQWTTWQEKQRQTFQQQLVYPYKGKTKISPVGDSVDHKNYVQREFGVYHNGRRVFRFFRLSPKSANKKVLPTIVCFMGHGKVKQVLTDRNSYQHACAKQFVEQGYLVFAMENVGMEPGRDSHHELDHLLRLDGYSWYSLLFAHQQILLKQVFSDKQVDTKKVGVTGVSTGGLLALSAAAFEPRISATSVQGIFGSMRVSFIQDRHRHCRCGAIPGLLPQFDLPEMALLVTPRAMHISNATSDGFSPAEAKRCLKLITPLYKQAGGDPPQFSEPSGRHEYNFDAALKFFEKTIGKPN